MGITRISVLSPSHPSLSLSLSLRWLLPPISKHKPRPKLKHQPKPNLTLTPTRILTPPKPSAANAEKLSSPPPSQPPPLPPRRRRSLRLSIPLTSSPLTPTGVARLSLPLLLLRLTIGLRSTLRLNPIRGSLTHHRLFSLSPHLAAGPHPQWIRINPPHPSLLTPTTLRVTPSLIQRSMLVYSTPCHRLQCSLTRPGRVPLCLT